MGTRYPVVMMSNRTRVWHNLRRSVQFVTVKSEQCVKGNTLCDIHIQKPRPVSIIDEETGTWCIDCTRERSREWQRDASSLAMNMLLLMDCPAVLTRDEAEWTNAYKDIVRAVTECFPDRAEKIVVELARRAPIKENG